MSGKSKIMTTQAPPQRATRRATPRRIIGANAVERKVRTLAEQSRHHPKPGLPFRVIGVYHALPGYLERQAPILDEVGSQHAHIMVAAIEITRELADVDPADYIRWRKRERDNQNFHLSGLTPD